MPEGVVFHNVDFELAGLRCACGCGHKVTLLVPDGHQVINDEGMATIRPSIGVLDAACKSHFFITAGQVEWLPPFSGAQASSIMQAQIARHAAHDPKPQSWIEQLAAGLYRLIDWIFGLFRRGT
jgi:hypothetical protein